MLFSPEPKAENLHWKEKRRQGEKKDKSSSHLLPFFPPSCCATELAFAPHGHHVMLSAGTGSESRVARTTKRCTRGIHVMRQPRNPGFLADERRWLLHDGHTVYLVYMMNGCALKPYVSMLAAPSGRNLLADAPADHIHHHGIWWGHGDVNGVTFYLELPSENPGAIRHRRWLELRRDDESIGCTHALDWVAPNGDVLLCETRRLSVRFGRPSGYTLDLESAYTAQADLRFGTTKESGMPLIRLADAFNGRAGGEIVNSKGARGERGTFGQPARWVDYHAPVPAGYAAGGREGLACMDHPTNPDHPTRWFTREYGPLSPREGNHFVGEQRLPAGETLRLRHRVYVHEGDETAADVEGVYTEFASS
jgi:hypothetical protein